MSARLTATRVLSEVIGQRRSLSVALPSAFMAMKNPADQALVSEICYGVMRWYLRLEAVIGRILHRPLKKKEIEVKCLLLVGLYQLIYMRVPAHAAVAETVAVTNYLGKPWAKGLVNAVLRNYQRNRDILDEVDQDEVARISHPEWLLAEIKSSCFDTWHEIVAANNRVAPIVLRVNITKISRQNYLKVLLDNNIEAEAVAGIPQAIKLYKLQDVTMLPGFADGWFSVQDSAAQLAAPLLDLKPGMRVLDACAAPGGKSCHILECESDIELIALDRDKNRIKRVYENLQRLGFEAQVLVGDASQPGSWWDGREFERILLDAPCSATGVIRRHPDIKYLRQADDIGGLVEMQGKLLQALWPLLKPGGQLLYVTCSILSQENSEQVSRFLKRQKDASEVSIEAEWGRLSTVGRQVITGDNGMDGFYYACLKKC